MDLIVVGLLLTIFIKFCIIDSFEELKKMEKKQKNIFEKRKKEEEDLEDELTPAEKFDAEGKAFLSFLMSVSIYENSPCSKNCQAQGCELCEDDQIFDFSAMVDRLNENGEVALFDREVRYRYLTDPRCRKMFTYDYNKIEINNRTFVYREDITRCLRITEAHDRPPLQMYQLSCKDSFPSINGLNKALVKRKCVINRLLKESGLGKINECRREVMTIEGYERVIWKIFTIMTIGKQTGSAPHLSALMTSKI